MTLMCAHISGTAGCGRDLTPSKTWERICEVTASVTLLLWQSVLCQWAGIKATHHTMRLCFSGCILACTRASKWCEWLINSGSLYKRLDSKIYISRIFYFNSMRYVCVWSLLYLWIIVFDCSILRKKREKINLSTYLFEIYEINIIQRLSRYLNLATV